MRPMYPLTLIVAAVVVLIAYVPLHASEIDGRIESSAKQSYVFKTYLKGDDIKIQSKDGVVTLTGTVAEESHKSLAQETWQDCPVSKVWTTDWNSKVNVLPRTRMHGSRQK